MTSKQKLNIKSSIVDVNNCLNSVFPLFNSLNRELHPGQRLINIYSICFSFHKADCHSNESKAHHCNTLNDIMLNISSEPNTVVIISDTSIKTNVTSSIIHIYLFSSLLKKTLHHAINIMLIMAELLAFRYGINQAVQIPSSFYIIIITNILYIVQIFFDLFIHLYQL